MEKKGKGAIAKSQGQGIVTAGHGRYFLNSSTSYANKKMDFQCLFILWLILKYKNNIRMTDLMVFIPEIICLK